MKSFVYRLDNCYYGTRIRTSDVVSNAYVYKHLKMGNNLTKTV